MTALLVDLVAQARAAGVVISRGRDGALLLEAPNGAAAYAMTLRERDVDVLALYDWHGAQLGDPQPCRLCGDLALLRDPISRKPCHKVCVDALLHADRPTRPTRRGRATR
jgi:hypothetical protein